MRNRLRKAAAAIATGVASQIGRDEVLVLCGLACATVALWPSCGRQALMLPGIVLLWMALPPRVGFVVREQPRPQKERT